jgi:hypothetical protein
MARRIRTVIGSRRALREAARLPPDMSDLEDLSDRLAEIEVEHASLEAELAAFRVEYMRQVGTVMAQVHELEARYLRRLADRSGSAEDAATAAAAEEQARRETGEAQAVAPPPGPRPTDDLKKLFRDAAKLMHPDLAGDEDGRRHAESFMKRLNQAYRDGDAAAIVELLEQWGVEPAPEARREGLQGAVAEAERRLEQARQSDLARIMERVMAATARGEDLLAEMRTAALHELARWRRLLASLG